MRLSSAHSGRPESTADFLADREGLTGTNRATFLNELHGTFGFRLRHPRWAVAALGAWVAGVAVSGVLLERSRGGGPVSVFPWLSIVLFGATLIIALIHAERQPLRANQELEWRAYCLLIRPVILADRPGLLDRNLRIDCAKYEGNVTGIAPTIKAFLWNVRSINFWLPAAVGWGIGAVPLLLWQFLRGSALWVFVLPLVGSILVPVGWDIFRFSTYVRVGKSAREIA